MFYIYIIWYFINIKYQNEKNNFKISQTKAIFTYQTDLITTNKYLFVDESLVHTYYICDLDTCDFSCVVEIINNNVKFKGLIFFILFNGFVDIISGDTSKFLNN